MVSFMMYCGGKWVPVEPEDAARYAWVYRSGDAFRAAAGAAVRRGLQALRAGGQGCVRRGGPLPLQRSPEGSTQQQHQHRHHTHCRRYKRYSPPPPRARRDASVQTDSQTRARLPLRPKNVTRNTQAAFKLISSDTSTDADIPSKHIALNHTKLTEKTSPKKRQRILSDDMETSDENISLRRITSDASPKMRQKMNVDRYPLSHNENIPLRRIACSTATKFTENCMSPKRRRIICNDTDTSTDEHIPLKRIIQNETSDKLLITDENLSPKMGMTSSNVNKMTLKRNKIGRFMKPSKIPNKNNKETQNENECIKKMNNNEQNRKSDSIKVKQTRSEPERRVLQELSSDTDIFQEKSIQTRLRHTARSNIRKPDNNVVKISSDSDNEKKKLSDKESQVIFKGNLSQTTVSKGRFKELIVNEDDVVLLRTFIEKKCPYIDLYKFDCSDEYKQEIFFKINPVVKLEHCRRTEKMIRERQRLLFAEQLGLQSVCSSDGEEKRSQKSRRNDKEGTSERVQADRDSTTEKTNQKEKGDGARVEKKQKTRERVQSDRESTTERTKQKEKDGDRDRVEKKQKKTSERGQSDRTDSTERTQQKEKDGDRDRVEKKQKKTSERGQSDRTDSTERTQQKEKDGDRDRVEKKQKKTSERGQSDRTDSTERTQQKENGDSDKVEKKQKKSRVMFKRSSVPPGREYSSLEDHSIVAWLSADPRRERSVNGNRMWRLLQDQYTAITGQRRTWHSLRNRYLRYILPALGHLALPAGQAARLRAAAATGELKARAVSRRASILRVQPVRSASASASASSRLRPARPPPPPAARTAAAAAAAPPAGSGPRSRRLYNPAPP